MSDFDPELSGSRPVVSTSQAASVLVLGTTLATLADVIVPLIVVRLTGKSEVASLMSLLLVYNTVTLVALLGFPGTITYFLPERSIVERAAIARRVMLILMALSLVAGVVLLLAGAFGQTAIGWFSTVAAEQRTDIEPLMLISLVPLGDLPARMLPNLLVAEHRPRPAAAYGVLRSLGTSVSSVVPLALGYGAWEVAAALIVVAMLQAAFLAWQMRRLYGRVPRHPASLSVGELFRFASPLGITDMVSLLNSKFDLFLILFLYTDSAFADYRAGGWQIPVVTQIPYMVGTALAPRLVVLFGEAKPHEAIALWRQSITKVALLVVPVTLVFVVAADDAVELLFNGDYPRSAEVLRWYALLGVGRVAAFGTVIMAAGRPRLVMRAAALSLLSNVAISLPLLSWLGFVGPAMGTFLAFIPMVFYYCWCIARATGLQFREIFPLVAYAKVLAVALVGAMLALVFRSQIDWPASWAFTAQFVIVVGSFAALGSLTGIITRADWAFAGGWLRLKMLRR
jgi:O-antigen/teichoic acid export membrane protein